MDIQEDKRLVIDIDGVLAKKQDRGYSDLDPNRELVEKIREYKENGFYIILNTARNMRTFEGRIGKINAETAPKLIEWLGEHDIPYDEIHYGKPWCGYEGFYIDDKALRPHEFLENSYEELKELIESD